LDLIAGWSAWRAIGLLCCFHFVTFLHSGAINRLARCHGGYSFFLLVALGSVLQHATAGGVVLTLVRFFFWASGIPWFQSCLWRLVRGVYIGHLAQAGKMEYLRPFPL
jgi:hypothetical protein